MNQPTWIITPAELRQELASKNAPKLLDVRQQEEFDETHIEGCTLIPLGELESRASELSKDEDIVAYCAAGVRSMQAVMLLKQLGFKKVRSLEGGIHAWEGQYTTREPQSAFRSRPRLPLIPIQELTQAFST